ncbi:MAG: zeta toxin family protein [Eubacterium sp.]|nr:zeta toxin family protein [Eubacterium sp.]
METDLTSYSVDDVNRGVKEVYDYVTHNKLPCNKPNAILLGGQGGAGKSTLHELFTELYAGNIVIINGDEYRRYHPHYAKICEEYGENAANHTQSIANTIAAFLMEKLSNEGYNLVIEGTCRRADVPLKTCCDLKEKGYTVELSVMCTSADVAWQSTIDRYNEMANTEGMIPRAVPRDKFEATVAALPDNIEALYKTGNFDEITLYNRQKECLYRMTETPNVSPYNTMYDSLHPDEILPFLELAKSR